MYPEAPSRMKTAHLGTVCPLVPTEANDLGSPEMQGPPKGQAPPPMSSPAALGLRPHRARRVQRDQRVERTGPHKEGSREDPKGHPCTAALDLEVTHRAGKQRTVGGAGAWEWGEWPTSVPWKGHRAVKGPFRLRFCSQERQKRRAQVSEPLCPGVKAGPAPAGPQPASSCLLQQRGKGKGPTCRLAASGPRGLRASLPSPPAGAGGSRWALPFVSTQRLSAAWEQNPWSANCLDMGWAVAPGKQPLSFKEGKWGPESISVRHTWALPALRLRSSTTLAQLLSPCKLPLHGAAQGPQGCAGPGGSH